VKISVIEVKVLGKKEQKWDEKAGPKKKGKGL